MVTTTYIFWYLICMDLQDAEHICITKIFYELNADLNALWSIIFLHVFKCLSLQGNRWQGILKVILVFYTFSCQKLNHNFDGTHYCLVHSITKIHCNYNWFVLIYLEYMQSFVLFIYILVDYKIQRSLSYNLLYQFEVIPEV